MVRLATLLLFVSLFGVVVNVEIYDLVDEISNMCHFIPEVGDILAQAIKKANSFVKLIMKGNLVRNARSDPQNSITAAQLQELIEGLDQSKLTIPSENQILSSMAEIRDIVTTIRSNYNQYVSEYRNHHLKYNSRDAMNFVESFYFNFNLKAELDKIEQILIGDIQTPNLLERLGLTREFELLLCARATSHQMNIIQINHDILEAEMKALELAKFRFLVADLTGSFDETQDHLVEFEYFLERFVKRTSRVQSKVKKALKMAPREFWKCDPLIPTEGETYVKLDPVFRSYITQETDLDRDLGPRDNSAGGIAIRIHGNCDRYQLAYVRNGTQYGEKSPCRGIVRNCHDSEEGVIICFEESGLEYKYGSVSSLDGKRIWGKENAQCKYAVEIRQHFTLDGQVDVCLCTCDEKDREQAVRYFSFLECSSDYNENKVITGVRLIKRNNLFIHFEIQQALLGKNADIKNDTVEWTQDCTNGEEPDLTEEGSFYKVTWDNNAVNLDDLSCPPRTVVTGLKFGQDEGSLRLELRCTPFNFTSGQLDNSDHIIQFASGKRPNHEIDDHLPREAGNRHVLDKIGKSVSFRKSNDREDAGSSLVPWIDIQKVSMENPAPLAGISLILKSGFQSSGYIALKITSLDFSGYFQSESDEYLRQLVKVILQRAKNVTDTRSTIHLKKYGGARKLKSSYSKKHINLP
ncbi:hypothetical protein QAD02_017941 [Eretmocerus hayati]|uniref:Uncharacterized protein n=1 Tax=Eretmocerus hayati TaxID=131215 RepID=A0ACC2PF08_9HYME|nr:hypothetical protein QAD02_017941 [Eretmocerus hayati]